MKVYTPVIYWFDKSAAITATDIQPIEVPASKKREVERNCERYYKIATVGVEKVVRIWEYCWEKLIQTVHVDFIAQLEGHQKSINCCKFSPNGEMLATGDVDGCLFIWQYSDEEVLINPIDDATFPPNREIWKKKRALSRDGDIYCVCWSPDSKLIASGSTDNSIAVHDVATGSRKWDLRNFRNFPISLVWDPYFNYLVSFSTDRRVDIIDAKRGHRMRNLFAINGLDSQLKNVRTDPEVAYKLFHDSQLVTFTRTIDFSPCGSLLFVPTAHLEVSGSNIYGTYVIRRSDFETCRPCALLPSTKPTVFVRCSPIVYELLDKEENFLGLPYRVVFGILTKDTITIHDTQHASPIIFVNNLHYDILSGFAWAPDGKNIAISSHEGFISFISDFEQDFGERTQIPKMPDEDINAIKRSKKNAEESVKKRKSMNGEKMRSGNAFLPSSTLSEKEVVPVFFKKSPQSSTPKIEKAKSSARRIKTIALD